MSVRTVVRYTLVVLLLLVIGAPLIWMLLSSFQPNADLIGGRTVIAIRDFTLSNYARLAGEANYLLYLRNSLIVAAASTAIAVPIALLAAYSVFRTRYRGRRTIYYMLLIVYVFPGVLLLAPLYKIFAMVHLLNSWASLVIMNVTFAVPFSVWLMRGFFSSIPPGIEEAAAIDAANDLTILRLIIIPLTLPGVAVTATYTFVLSWTEYLFASVFLVGDNLKTLPVGLQGLITQYNIDWGMLSAAAVLTAIPVIVLFAFTGRYFVEGITAGGSK